MTPTSTIEELVWMHQCNGVVQRGAILQGGAEVIDALIEGLPDQRGSLLSISIRLLADLGDRRAVLPLIEVLVRDCWSEVGTASSIQDRVIWWISPGMRRLERFTVETQRVLARTQAAGALAQLGDPRAVGALMAVRNDPDERVRAAIQDALIKLGQPDPM